MRCWWVLAVLVFAGSLFLFPTWADASFVVNDPLWFADSAENAPWASFMGHHPLYHLLVLAAKAPLDALGVERAAHVAVKVVSGLGAAAIVLLLGWAAGGGSRRGGALLIALILVSTRGFVLEAATGENVLPASAAALAAMLMACRPTPRWTSVGVTFVVSLLLRQDNLLLLPGLLWALSRHRTAGTRWKALVQFTAATGVATILGYAVLYAVGAPDGQGFVTWLLKLALDEQGSLGAWSGSAGFHFFWHAVAAGNCMTGIVGEDATVHVAIGFGTLGAMLLAGSMQRGTERVGPLGLSAALVIGARVVFFSWFEPANWEWWLLPTILVAAVAVSMTRGGTRRPPTLRLCGLALAWALCILLLAAHGPSTWRLRQRTLVESARAALALGTPHCDYLAYGQRARAAFHLLRVPATFVPPLPASRLDASATEIEAAALPLVEWLQARLGDRPHPMVLLMDRHVGFGMPAEDAVDRDPLHRYVDGIPKPKDMVVLQRRFGRVESVGWNVGPFRSGG